MVPRPKRSLWPYARPAARWRRRRNDLYWPRGAVFVPSGVGYLRSFLFLLLLSLPALNVPVRATPIAFLETPVPEGADGRNLAVARVVRGILSYTRWPAEPAMLKLCVAGAPRFAGGLATMSSGPGRRMGISRLTGASPPAEGCNALYLGRVDADVRKRLLASARGQAIVTIDEDDQPCHGGAMFCLRMTPDGVAFELSLDAVSRSTVRIDPKVLLLSRRGARS